MTELAFDSAPEVRTTDVDEAADALGRVYVAAQLTPIDTKSVNMRMNALQLPLLTAGYLGFGADIAIRADDPKRAAYSVTRSRLTQRQHRAWWRIGPRLSVAPCEFCLV
jgi:hypothetical protein